jgi:glycolate oxidase iron-sulfur subunit
MAEGTGMMLNPLDVPDEEILTRCIHCGLCLQVCPTYNLTFRERSSPRGRIRLIRAVLRGELDITDGFAEEMNFCLDCQACQTVCPAGVRYGRLVEASRVLVARSGKDRGRWIKRFFFRRVFPHAARLKRISKWLRFYQQSIRPLLKKTGVFRWLPAKLRNIEPLAPPVSPFFSDEILPEYIRPNGRVRYRIGFLRGCLMNTMFADINLDTVEVLLVNGCEIWNPAHQVCCGSLAAHNGDFEVARELARKNVDAFFQTELDAIVVNSAGCGAFMKEYGELLADDPEYAEKAHRFSALVKDVHEFLDGIELVPPEHPVQERITYDDACHLIHTQGISEEPRRLLRKIPGVDLVELEEASWCCGSAGIYNIVHYETSMQILARKIEHILETGARIVATGNPGCLVQLRAGVRERGLPIRVVHPISLLRQSYGERARYFERGNSGDARD